MSEENQDQPNSSTNRPTPHTPTQETQQMLPIPEPQPHQPQRARARRWGGLFRWARKPTVWFAIASAILNLIQAGWKFKPDVQIVPAATVDKADALGTEFSFTNTGVLPLEDVRFGCLLRPNMLFEGNEPGQKPVDMLPSKKAVTRNCAVHLESGPYQLKVLNPENIKLQVYAIYKLPYLGWEMKSTADFSVRTFVDQSSYVLVPDYGE